MNNKPTHVDFRRLSLFRICLLFSLGRAAYYIGGGYSSIATSLVDPDRENWDPKSPFAQEELYEKLSEENPDNRWYMWRARLCTPKWSMAAMCTLTALLLLPLVAALIAIQLLIL